MIKVDNSVVDTKATFPDGSLAMKARTPRGVGIVYITWHYENDAELFALICLRRHYADRKAILYMPYIPHARMDRVKNANDVFTLKYFCEVINSLDFERVDVLDAHSNVALALLNRVHQVNVNDHIETAIRLHDNGNLALFFPDEGAMKRYGEDLATLGYKFAFGMKKREWETGKILGLDVMQHENIVDKDVLIIDDICSKGGTFFHSAKALLDAGAESVSLYITHCENTILQGEIFTSGLINRVYTTDSLVHCDELADKLIYV
jgi:ribose-phosphate pyrophosphokinase